MALCLPFSYTESFSLTTREYLTFVSAFLARPKPLVISNIMIFPTFYINLGFFQAILAQCMVQS